MRSSPSEGRRGPLHIRHAAVWIGDDRRCAGCRAASAVVRGVGERGRPGGIDFGNQNASLTANNPGNPEFILFATSSQIDTGAGLDARVAFNLSRDICSRGGVHWTRRRRRSQITSDSEAVPNITLTEDLYTYFIEAAAVVAPSRPPVRPWTRPAVCLRWRRISAAARRRVDARRYGNRVRCRRRREVFLCSGRTDSCAPSVCAPMAGFTCAPAGSN